MNFKKKFICLSLIITTVLLSSVVTSQDYQNVEPHTCGGISTSLSRSCFVGTIANSKVDAIEEIKDDVSVQPEPDNPLIEETKDDVVKDEPALNDVQTTHIIQFGAFMLRENTLDLANELTEKGIKVKVYEMKCKNGSFIYKVMSEKTYPSIDKAHLDEDKYKKMGYDCFVVTLNNRD